MTRSYSGWFSRAVWGGLFAVSLLAAAEAQAGARCVAHRGNNVAEFENSWASVRSAAEMSADGIEFDVHHTRDGVALLSHDPTLIKLGEGAECPLDTPLIEMDAADVLRRCTLKNGEPIPRLDEVLKEAEGWNSVLFVELKDVPSADTVALLRASHASLGDRLRVISFERDAVDAVAEVSGLKRYKLAVLTVYARTRRRLEAGLAGWDLMMVRRRRIRRVQKHGGEVAVWTINEPEKMRRLADRGVSWITTDDPRTCMDTLKSR